MPRKMKGDNMTTTGIESVEAKRAYEELKPETTAMILKAEALQVIDDASFELAGRIGVEISTRIKFVEQKFEAPKSASHKAWRAICDLEREIIDPLKAVKTAISKKAGAYHAEKARKAREDEERRLAEARKAAEDAAIEQAAELEAAGDAEGAQATIENVPVPVAAAIEATPKVNGMKQVTRWRFRIVNELAIPREFLIVDEQKLRKYAEAMKASAKVAGVEFYPETTAAFGGGR